eukprot:Sspe_Gene.81292::Locus_51965_Transcript_1_1_Confidence_1.000_Length_500::g.81292::m.81292
MHYTMLVTLAVATVLGGVFGDVCSGECMLNTDCSRNGTQCTVCIGKPSVSEKGRCGADCGMRCTSDTQCLNKKYCGYCTGGVCSEHRNLTCGESCKLDNDCMRGGCSLCRKGVCVTNPPPRELEAAVSECTVGLTPCDTTWKSGMNQT